MSEWRLAGINSARNRIAVALGFCKLHAGGNVWERPGMRAFKTGVLWLAATCLCVIPSAASIAQSISVDLRLVLAVDISRSMNAEEQYLQRVGYVQAFRNPLVIEAVQRGPLRRIAVTYIEWAGEQNIAVPWTLLDGRAASEAFAKRLLARPARRARRTSISEALIFSAGLFDDRTFASPRRVIDISGDGPNNMGRGVEEARDLVTAQGITVNGLPIVMRTGSLASFFDMKDLDLYYEDCVIGGPGAFIVPVLARSGFASAILRKIILEIAGATPGPAASVVPAQFTRNASGMDCFLGEKQWRRFMRGQ